jgi:hypothetical protein
MKVRAVGADLFHADGRSERQTDRYEEANSRFPQISLTRLKTGFSGGRGGLCVYVCVCVCFRRAVPISNFYPFPDIQETKLNITNF